MSLPLTLEEKSIKTRPSPCPSFRKMPSTESLHKVCLLLGFEGFYIQNQYYCRELGWSAVKEGACGNIKYRMPMTLQQIKGRDRLNVTYLTARVHGLAFDDDPGEEAKPYTCFEQDVQDLYHKYKTDDQPWVAYKGGQAVKDTLKKLGIEAINLEHWGCKKIQSLLDPDTEPPEEDCGHHERGYCAAVKCNTFRQWLEWAKHQDDLHPTLGNCHFWN